MRKRNLSSRPRERYRERENGRPNSRDHGNIQLASSTVGTRLPSSTPVVVLTGSRSYSSQTLVNQRERVEERVSGYGDNFEGSRDSGDTSSVGDPDLASAFDDMAVGFGSGKRHGSRGSKSRQIMELRERGMGDVKGSGKGSIRRHC